ncbi:PTS fructose transporter subunit IIC [Erysipelothrix inopinata]|uniref:PTS fructose transporter subunit IIC n=1 Tax=Erysipelothrix inopinata TaxID=225084 RepID=A0A7G9RX17_9FIRM|nr:PTS fructose transporter subunit IIC [Erysipelothrix inopinata]QNN60142.1 PTS fructose transporter subunit IIC [Erysipelothrix inopinata]
MKKILKDIQKHLLSGVSFMMPVVVAGGVILAISLLGAEQTAKGLVPTNPIMIYLNQLGKAGMTMMIPVFAAYIAYSAAGKPGLTPGFILGYIANSVIMVNGVEVKSGFLGALLLGLLAGYMVNWMKGWKIAKNKTLRSIMPILIMPIFTVLVLGLAYYFIIAIPISALVTWLTNVMTELNGGSKTIFAIFMGIFAEIDFGGPMTKTISMFTLSMINEGVMEPNGIFRVLVAVPPLGIFLASLIAKNKFTEEERDNAKAVGIIGALGITEGAIPFAIKDPKAVYPASIIGCITAALIAAYGNVTCPVPHGGFIVLPVVGNKIWFVVAILAGAAVMAILLKILKKDVVESVA